MAVVQLHCTDVCLQSIHGLILLLVQNTNGERKLLRRGGQGEKGAGRGLNIEKEAEKEG
jgi:hypothetical protein